MLNVVKLIREKIPKLKVLLIGNGELYPDTIKAFEKEKINFQTPGFVQPDQLPEYFAKCKVLLFPTKRDAWGLVASEACAAGIPVVTTPYAGVKDELIIDNVNGFIIEPNVEEWAEKICMLLENIVTYEQFSKEARKSSLKYNYQDAASGIVNAVRSVL